MKKNTKYLLFLLGAAVAVSAGSLLLRRSSSGPPVARILQDGVLLEEIPLDKVEVSYSFDITDGAGGTNTILVEPGRIRVSQANCPDQVCVEMGAISDGTDPIVCLPHKLVIEIVGGAEALDAAAG